MGQILSDLSYNTKTLKPIGRPVDDLKALYSDKREDYNYVIDSLNATETALNQVPFHDKDKHIIDVAKNKFQDTFSSFEEEGDFENRIVDTKTLANDLTNRFGLLDVQRVAQEKGAYQADQKERLTKGKITRQQYQNAVRDSERNYKGLEKDPTTGQYIGTYNGTQVQDFVNASEKVAEVLDGFKANKIILTDTNGNAIIRNEAGTGYMSTGTKESVSEAELIRAAKAYLEASPEIQSQFQEDIYFELQNLLHDENDNRRGVTTDDIRRLISNSNSVETMAKLGIKSAKDLNNLDEILKDTNLETVYSFIRKDQLMNNAMVLGVEKESYEKYEAKYLKDWLLEARLDNEATSFDRFGILHSYNTQDKITSETLDRTSKLYTKGIDNIAALENDITTMQKNGAHPNDIQRKKDEIKTQQRTVDLINQRMQSTLKATPELLKEARGTEGKVNRGSFTPTSFPNFPGHTGGVKPLTTTFDINEGALNRLLFKGIGNELTSEDLAPYIKLDRGLSYAESSKNTINVEDVKGVAQTKSEFIDSTKSNKPIDNAAVKAYIYNTLKNGDEEALEKLNITEDTKSKLRSRYEQHLDNSRRLTARRLNDTADKLKKKAEDTEINYTEEFKLFNLPDLSPKEERNNPVHQINFMAGKITELDANYFTQLTSTMSNLDLKTHIEESFDVDDEDGDIIWKDGKVQASLDSIPDINTGVYSPVLVFEVPIKTGKNTTENIQIPVHYNEPTYIAKYKEALESHRDRLVSQSQKQKLTSSQAQELDRVNTNLYNTSKYARDFDLLGLYTAKNEEIIPFEFWDGYESNIQVFENGSPQDLSYYLVDGKEQNLKYYATNRNTGKQVLASKDELEYNKDLVAIGASTPKDLKIIYSNMIYSNRLDKSTNKDDFNVSLEDTIDVTSVFENDIKSGVNPRVHKNNEASVKALKMLYPDLIITDALRPTDSIVGAEDSKHKDANALDFRLNEDSRKLTQLSFEDKQRLGIESAEIHNGNHVHLVFLNR